MSRLTRRSPVPLQILAAALCVTAAVYGWCGEDTPAVNLFEEALTVSKELDPATDLEQCRKEWQKLLDKTKAALAKAQAEDNELTPVQTVATLNRELLIDRNVSYISNRYWRDSLFTSALIKKRGNCLATSLLYYLVARELKLPVYMSFLPEHAFVRWDDGATVINIETTQQGIRFSDEAMLAAHDLSQADLKPNGFLCKLDENQIFARLLRVWAGVEFSLERRKEAFELLHRAQMLMPGSPELRLLEMAFLVFEGDSAKVQAILEEILNEKASGPWAQASAVLAYVNFLESRGKADEAIKLLQARYEEAPRGMRVKMIENLGVLYRHKRDFDRAIFFHKLHTTLHPDEDSYNQLASALTEAHRDKEAVEAYEKALTFNPESFFTQVILAGLYERTGEKAKGRAYFAKIEEPREHRITWYCALVWYYAVIKEPALMLRNMEAAFKLDGSGHAYQYFVREPDMDPYRNDAEFVKLMEAHAPQPVRPDSPPKKQDQPVPEKEPVPVP